MPNAFTGASAKGKIGLLEAADHGTILFDEINELSLENQVLLLHFLQNKTITPIGALESKKIDARIISTSGRDLREMIEEGTFRRDLYYRICVADIHIPPIRERKEEILPFVNHFVDRFADGFGIDPKSLATSPEKMQQLTQLDWMGNIREIENFAQQICFMGDTLEGLEGCIEQVSHSIKHTEVATAARGGSSRKTLKEAIKEFEKDYIQTVIDETPDLHTAAEELGISFSTLCRKKAELGIYRKRNRPGK